VRELHLKDRTDDFLKRLKIAGCWWLTPVILATWGAGIGRIII
jgi:hypothetical protein